MITRSKKKQLNSPQNRRLRKQNEQHALILSSPLSGYASHAPDKQQEFAAFFLEEVSLEIKEVNVKDHGMMNISIQLMNLNENDKIYYQNDYWSAMMTVITIKLIALTREKKKCFQSRLLNQISMFHQS